MIIDVIPHFFPSFPYLLRCTGICLTAPILGSKAVPVIVRVVVSP